MIRVLLFLLAASVQAGGLTALVQPHGSTPLAVVADVDGVTYTFPRDAVPDPSWLVLPRGAVTEAVLSTSTNRVSLSLPTVRIPGVRIAVEVPAGLLSLSLRGSAGGALQRTETRPEGPGWVTRSTRGVEVGLPPWSSRETVAVSVHHETSPWSATVSGDGVVKFDFESGVSQWSFYPDAWGFVPRRITLGGADAGRFQMTVGAYGPQTDLPADPATILSWPRQNWRSPSREWFLWSGTSVLVLVSGNYSIQDRYLKRLAFFVEKTGYRGRLVSDAEVAHLHGWNAHDYAATDLARFYSLAAEQKFALNAAELELRDRLVGSGVLKPVSGRWEPGVGALVGISDESPPALKSVLFVHEAFHGLYYTSDRFRDGVKQAWDGLGDDARAAFRAFLAMSRYDPENEALMINEFQAYVLQRASSEWAAFFRERVLGGQSDERLSRLLRAARAVEEVITHLYGLRSGQVSSITVARVP